MKLQQILNLVLIFSFCLFSGNSSCSDQTESKEDGLDEIEIEEASSYIGIAPIGRILLSRTAGRYDSLVEDVLKVVGIPKSSIAIKTTRVKGAFTLIRKDCRARYFAYNEAFFDEVQDSTQTEKAIQSICFHELAHHFYLHPLQKDKNSHFKEKQADRYSGFQMRVIGATLDESKAAIIAFGEDEGTITHPNKATRLAEIEAGFYEASRTLFKDSTYLEAEEKLDSLRLINAMTKIQDNDKSFTPDKPVRSQGVDSPGFESISPQPIFTFLGEIISINEENKILLFESEEEIGEVIPVSSTAPFTLFTVGGYSYLVEENTIYFNGLGGSKLQVGKRIN